MKRIATLVLIFYPFSSFAGEGVKIEDVKRQYDEIHTLSSSFTQKTYPKSDDEVGSASGGSRLSEASRLSKEFKGKFIAERPNKFRMEVTKPEKQILLSDGKVLWIYLLKEKQAIKTSPEEGLALPVEIFFNPFEVYHVGWLPSANPPKADSPKDNKPILEVRPKEEGTLFEKAWVEIHPKTLLIKEIQLFDYEGNRIHYTFSNLRINQKVKPSTFQFIPPDGVDVVDR